MNDDELVRRLKEQSPREYSFAEIMELKARLRRSPEVRAALEEALQLEGDLSGALGEIQLSADHLLGRVEERARRTPARPQFWKWLGLASLLIVAGTAGWLRGNLPLGRPGGPPIPLVQNDDKHQSEQSVSEVASPDKEGVTLSDSSLANAESAQASAAISALDLPAFQRGSNEPLATEMSKSETPAVIAPEVPAGPWVDWLPPAERALKSTHPERFGDLAAMHLDRMTREDFGAWWGPVGGQPLVVNQETIGNRPTVQMDGWAQLKAPWLVDTQLRFVPFDQRDFTLFFWNGLEGLALRNYRERQPHLWAAFRVRRAPGEIAPNWWGLLTTDSGAADRSGAPGWDVGIVQNRLELSIGGAALLSVPVTQIPQEVLCHGQFRLRGFRWLRVNDSARVPEPARPNQLPSAAPADWDWQLAANSSLMLQREADGSATFTSTNKTEVAQAFVAIGRPGLFETLVQVAAADPGTGIFLGDAKGIPLGYLTFSRDRQNGQLTYAAVRPQERREESAYQPRDFPPPYFVEGQWLKLVAGLGIWQTSCSADGLHFGHVMENPLRDVPGAVGTVGIFCWPAETPRTIRLQGAKVQRLADLEIVAGLPEIEVPTDEARKWRYQDSWWLAGWKQRPAEVSFNDWWDAWAIATLQQGPPLQLAQDLMTPLIQSARNRLSPEKLQVFLSDLLSLDDAWSDEKARRWEREFVAVSRARKVAHREVTSHEGWVNWLSLPLWSSSTGHDLWAQELSDDLVELAFQEDWQRLREQAGLTQVWFSTAHPDQSLRDKDAIAERVARWGKGTALEMRGERPETVGDVLPVIWRHPLQILVNKEAYNIAAELNSALASESFADACKVVMGLDGSTIRGLLPDRKDRDLFVSLDVALHLATSEAPAFLERLKVDLSPLGWLQVRQAMADANVPVMEASTLQFWGTEPASAAELWLGDRAMSLGQTLVATSAYERGLRWASGDLASQLQARLALSRGMEGFPVSGEADTEIAGRAVTDILGETRGTHERRGLVAPVSTKMEMPLEPRRYRWEHLGRFEGQSGQNAGRGEYRQSDAFTRQLAIAQEGDRVFLSNRFQINAYQRTTGQLLWSRGLDTEQGEAHDFPFVAMQPVVTGERLYARRLAKSGVELCALNTATGEVIWKSTAGEKAQVVSDPVVLGDAIYAIVAQPTEQDHLEMTWTRFAAAHGAVESAVPLFRVRDAWDRQPAVSLTTADSHFVASMGGVVVAFQASGEVNWLHRELWMPRPVNSLVFNTFVTSPLIAGRTVYVAVPDSRRVLALDLITGRRLWHASLRRLQGLLSANEQLILAATDEGLLALDAVTGAVQWETEIEQRRDVMSVGADTIWTVSQQGRPGERGWLQSVELNRRTGAIERVVPWDLPEADDWTFGPWWKVGDAIWGLAESGWRNTARAIVRLSPLNETEFPRQVRDSQSVWQSPLPVKDQRMVSAVLPGWQVYGVDSSRIRHDMGEVQGESNVLSIRLDARQTVRIVAKDLSELATGPVRMASERGQGVEWQVLVNGDLRLSLISRDDKPVWQTLPIAELVRNYVQEHPNETRFVVEIAAHSSSEKPVNTYWKSLSPGETRP